MSKLGTRVGAAVGVGVLATITMDAAMIAAAAIGGERFASKRLDPDVIGRWSGALLRGRWHNVDVSRAKPSPADLPLGILTHYLTGVSLTGLFLLLPIRLSFPAALSFGVATAVLPLFVLFPSLGYGVAGLRSGEAPRLVRVMLLGHAGFGIGIGLGTSLLIRAD